MRADSAGLVLVVDDDIFIQEAWLEKLQSTPCLSFESPRQVLAWAAAHPQEVKPITCVALAYYLNDALTGLQAAKPRLSSARALPTLQPAFSRAGVFGAKNCRLDLRS